jgi:two-component system, OmpR family, copper resistance phosphate regulon response regulator CusR
MRILVAESDLSLGIFLEMEFRAENHAVDLASDPAEVKSLVRDRHYDAAILDLHLGQHDGIELLRSVRATQEQLPILVLASRTSPENRVQLLDLGADDLVFKPFAFAELSARVRAVLRRGGHYAETVLRVEDLELSRLDRSVKRAGRKINLTPKEFALLEYLMRNTGQRVTRAEIIQQVWKNPLVSRTGVVDVYINGLRKKVDASCKHKLIHTVRGVGYRLQPSNAHGGNAA